MIEEYIGIISKSALFEGLEKDDIIRIVSCLNPKIHYFNKNELITVEGQKFNGIGLIIEGQATISKDKVSGDRIVMSIINQGDMFGEMIAFSNQNFWPATVQAEGFCRVVFLQPDKIISECEKVCPCHNNLIRNLLMIVSKRALMLSKKVEYLTIKSIRGKISAFLLDQYKMSQQLMFTLQINRNEMADFLNVSRPSMSREMAQMKKEGLIDYHLSTIRIIDKEKLKEDME